jgi:hypothetical protein
MAAYIVVVSGVVLPVAPFSRGTFVGIDEYARALRTRVLHVGEQRIVECAETLARPDQAIELIAACAAGRTDRLLLDAPVLPPEFFDLRTRFAGELLHRIGKYWLRVAAVIPQAEYDEPFARFVAEVRRGRHFRVFDARADAEAWLAGG